MTFLCKTFCFADDCPYSALETDSVGSAAPFEHPCPWILKTMVFSSCGWYRLAFRSVSSEQLAPSGWSWDWTCWIVSLGIHSPPSPTFLSWQVAVYQWDFLVVSGTLWEVQGADFTSSSNQLFVVLGVKWRFSPPWKLPFKILAPGSEEAEVIITRLFPVPAKNV